MAELAVPWPSSRPDFRIERHNIDDRMAARAPSYPADNGSHTILWASSHLPVLLSRSLLVRCTPLISVSLARSSLSSFTSPMLYAHTHTAILALVAMLRSLVMPGPARRLPASVCNATSASCVPPLGRLPCDVFLEHHGCPSTTCLAVGITVPATPADTGEPLRPSLGCEPLAPPCGLWRRRV